MGLTRKQAKEKMLAAKHGPVSFEYPGSEGRRNGILKDRAIFWSGNGRKGVKYWDVVDLIEFAGAKHPLWMRIGYYRQKRGRMRWASQTTITEPLGTWERLIVEVAREKDWFKRVILSAASKL